MMASANFQNYDRTLRRMYMMNLIEHLANERSGGFRASLVFNAHTGLPAIAQSGEFGRGPARVAEAAAR